AGELYIGGAGLARGYLKRAGLTAEKFVPNAFGEAGGRLYRTGDLARWRPDGALSFLGRVDHQVKVRGFRIELGEIEAALQDQDGVRRTVVLAREDIPGDKRLVAYVERENEDTPTAAMLAAALKQRLPHYMVPGAFVFLETLPQTTNGKVDRKALPAPDSLPGDREFTAPRTPIEEALAHIWADVLHKQQVGVDENFFELGGHSLLAMQVVARVRKTLGAELPLQSLFQEPTIAKLALGLERRRWQDKGLAPPPLVPVAREAGTQIFPQTFAQQRVWFMEQLEPNTPTYNIPTALTFTGKLDVQALEESLNDLIERHETLRTKFGVQDDRLVQIIEPKLRVSVELSNLEALPVDERQPQARRLMDEEAQRPFNLSLGPLVRATVFRLSGQEHILLFNMHHIIADAWSMGVLIGEWAALYAARCEGQPSQLAPLSIQYGDFAKWQTDWLQSGVLEQLTSYWQEYLKGAPPLIELPTDRPRSAAQSSRGATLLFHVTRDISDLLAKLGREDGVTLFMMLLASFKAMLYRYSGHADIVVGTPMSNRHHEELEALVGFFANTLVLRTDLSGDPTFRELVRRVRESSLGAYAHQDLPFERLVEQLGVDRRGGRMPIFQTMFMLCNVPTPKIDLPGLTLSYLPINSRTSKFDLFLHIEDDAYGLNGSFEYSTDLFDEQTVLRMIDHYKLLLEAAAKNPDARISDLPMLTAAENEFLLDRANSTAQAIEALPVHTMFERQAVLSAKAIAVVDQTGELSYAELNARANQLAHYLCGLGIGPESKVGLCIDRSVDAIVAVLGILKAGAGYVPMDPAYPADRLSFMLDDAGIAVLLTKQELADRLPQHQVRTVLVDLEWPVIGACSPESPDVSVDAQNLAYVIYTSGSTGRPKGVMIEHRSCAAFIQWAHTVFSAEELEQVFASTSLSFDLSVFELFAPLTRGGKVVVGANALDLTPERDVTLINTVPSVLSELVRSNLIPDGVKTINLAGEALPLSLVRSIRQKAPDLRILNLYGPTEDTTYSTFYEVPPDPDRAPLIGRPIANSQVYILDEEHQPVPPGATGEILLGGMGLARGYLGRPELTAERFVPNPFGGQRGSRLYKTGDRGRMLADGSIEYLGRRDYQVKVRGYRIELGEIEEVLDEQAGVRRAVVSAREDSPGDKRLVAYIESEEGRAATQDDLKNALRKRLPEFMVPSAFVFMETLPLTANGKVDRAVLPPPQKALPAFSDSPVPPRDSVETELVHMWEKLFDFGPIGIRTSFFDIGGHSLLALRLHGEILNRFGVEFPLATLFQRPTIEGLAEIVRSRVMQPEPKKAVARTPVSASFEEARLALVPIQPGGTQLPFFCVHPIGGSVWCYAELALQLGPDRPFYGLQSATLTGSSREDDSIEGMAARYVHAITATQAQGPYLLGGWSMGGIVALEVARQLMDQGREVGLLALMDSFPYIWGNGDGSIDETGLLESFVVDLTAIMEKQPTLDAEFSANGRDRLRLAFEYLRNAKVLAQEIDFTQFKQIWQQYRWNYRALVKYQPQKYAGKITMIAAAERHALIRRTPVNAWAPLAGGGLSIDVVPGDHYSLLRHPNVGKTAEKLRTFLESTQ
ncbi:MAG TPA: amino acid adenylation domain-containing protein, partial [Terriglobia bacterium]|nr:amino acid adenylation domain-containing protein [Terriglobia bacterium]